MLDTLLDVLGTLEFENDGWLSVARVEWQEWRCAVGLHVHTGSEDEPLQVWDVTCEGVRGSHIEDEAFYEIELTDEHPVLLPLQHPHVTLSFKGSPASPDALLGQLWESHAQAVGEWIEFQRYLNCHLTLSELLGSGSGLLAGGPKPLIERYAEVLNAHGIDVSFVNEREPVFWSGERWVPEPSDAQVLVLGRSYIVATDFQFSRQ